MNYKKEDLIKYRFGKAENTLKEAEALAKINHWETVSNRLYYSCFYAISAYLAKHDVQAITHKGIKSAFHKELIKNGIISKELGKLYNDLFNKRQEADYKDFAQFEQKDIEPLIAETRDFIQVVRRLIQKNDN